MTCIPSWTLGRVYSRTYNSSFIDDVRYSACAGMHGRVYVSYMHGC